LEVVCISRRLTATLSIDLMEFRLQKFAGKFFLFLDEATEVLKLGLSAWNLVSPEVVVDLARKDFIAQPKLSHLLQKVLNFDK